MTQMLRFIPAPAALLLLLVASAFSQPIPEDDGKLFFPPKLTVIATASNDLPSGESPKSKESDGNIISVRQYENRESEYLLPILFFEGAGSVSIPERYQTFFSTMETDNYTDSSDVAELPNGDRHPKYRQLLNIIGYRMGVFPHSRIALQGGYSALPGETAEVGTTRAEVVRDYLTTIWHVAPERITLAPPRPLCDSSANILRQEEAQQVMISTPNPELIRPITYYTVRTREDLFAFQITLDPSMDPAEVLGIEFTISLGDEIISSTEIPGHPDSTFYRVQGLWPAFQLQAKPEESLALQAFVRTAQGTVRATNSVRFSLKTKTRGERDYDAPSPLFSDYYSLPFFDWRDSSLTGLQQYYLEEYLKGFTASADEREGYRYKLTISGQGDLAENSAVDQATVSNMTRLLNMQSTAMKKLAAPQSRFPMVFLTGEEDEEKARIMLVGTWLGEDYLRMNEERRKRVQAREDSEEDSEISRSYDSSLYAVIIGRGNSVGRYLRQRIGAGMVDSIEVLQEIYSPYTYLPTPEERYYSRSVSMTLQPIYDESEDVYNEDEIYEYEYNEEDYSSPENGEAVPQEGEENTGTPSPE